MAVVEELRECAARAVLALEPERGLAFVDAVNDLLIDDVVDGRLELLLAVVRTRLDDADDDLLAELVLVLLAAPTEVLET